MLTPSHNPVYTQPGSHAHIHMLPCPPHTHTCSCTIQIYPLPQPPRLTYGSPHPLQSKFTQPHTALLPHIPLATLRGRPTGSYTETQHTGSLTLSLCLSHPLPPTSATSSIQHTRSPTVPHPGQGIRWVAARCWNQVLPVPLQTLTLVSRGRQTDRQTHHACPSAGLRPSAAPRGSLFLIMGQRACLLTQLEMVRE